MVARHAFQSTVYTNSSLVAVVIRYTSNWWSHCSEAAFPTSLQLNEKPPRFHTGLGDD